MDVKEVNGEVTVIEKEVAPERMQQLRTQGRGRLLHPHATLKAIGHDVKPGVPPYPEDTKFVAEGTPPLLDVKNLKVYFPIRKGILLRTVGHVKAVDGVSFAVYRGQTMGLVGESGCGKTTAGRAILRLIEPDAGEVTYNGVDVRKLGGSDLRQAAAEDADHLPGSLRQHEPADDDRIDAHGADDHPSPRCNTRDRRDKAVALLGGSRSQGGASAALSARVFRRAASTDLHRAIAWRWSRSSSCAMNRYPPWMSRCKPRC